MGKFSVILISSSCIKELDPYFVVWAHANNLITISDFYARNILSEREVSFSGFIPSDCVVFSVNVRMPSFVGDYQDGYEKKYGITKRIFTIRKKMLLKAGNAEGRQKTARTLLEDVIIPHLEVQFKKHVEEVCKKKKIVLVYKGLDGELKNALPSLVNAVAAHNVLKKSAATKDAQKISARSSAG